MKKIQKLDMAVEQLEDALKMYFEGRYHSATVLGGAAEQLLAGYVIKNEMTPAFLQDRTTITMIANGLGKHAGIASGQITEKKIGDKLNFGYNQAKHAGKNDHVVPIDPQI